MKLKPKFAVLIFLAISIISFKENPVYNFSPEKDTLASSYSSDVIDKWMAIQIRLMSTTIASFNGPFVRIYSYSGVAAFEAIRPGIQKNSSRLFSLSALNNIPAMPETDAGKNIIGLRASMLRLLL